MKNKEFTNITEGDKFKIISPVDYFDYFKAGEELTFTASSAWEEYKYYATGNITLPGEKNIYTHIKNSNHLDGLDFKIISKLISKEELLSLIESQKKRGVYFTVWFIKKDGTERKMTCRFGVKKHLHGGKSTLDETKFFTVYSMADADYRAVNKETVFKVKVGGLVYEVEQ